MTAEQYAVKQGARTARRLPDWKGFTCYEAVYGGSGLDDIPAIGLPQIILEKGGAFRMATPEETLRYMDEVEIADG